MVLQTKIKRMEILKYGKSLYKLWKRAKRQKRKVLSKRLLIR